MESSSLWLTYSSWEPETCYLLACGFSPLLSLLDGSSVGILRWRVGWTDAHLCPSGHCQHTLPSGFPVVLFSHTYHLPMPQAACLNRLLPWLTFALVPTAHNSISRAESEPLHLQPRIPGASYAFLTSRVCLGPTSASEVCGFVPNPSIDSSLGC